MKAFPTNIDVATGGDSWRTEHGMDLRDYFAAKAIQALIPLLADQANISNGDERRKEVSMLAYKQADAMMEARKPK